MNRSDFQILAEIRLREAKALLADKKFDGAYYLCGYAVECALKSCIAKLTKKHDFPDKTLVINSYVHDLVKLIEVCGLESSLTKEINSDPEFGNYWSIVKDWKESSRYERNRQKKACAPYQAITDEKKGVLKWIKQHW
jgi:HEPN domain-containing protein